MSEHIGKSRVFTMDGDELIGTVSSAEELEALLKRHYLTLDEVWGHPLEPYSTFAQTVAEEHPKLQSPVEIEEVE